MSIFDFYDDEFLPGDKSRRELKTKVIEFEEFKQDASGEEIFTEKKKSFRFPYLISGLVFGILLFQLLRLQITEGNFHKTLAQGNRLRVREVVAARGLIYGSSGEILAQNKPSFDLEIYPLDFPRAAADKEALINKISQASQISPDVIREKIAERGYSTYDPITLKKNLDRDTAMILEYKMINLPGVVIAKKPIREYADIAGLGPLIGYLGKMTDKDLLSHPEYKLSYEIGREGLESYYEDVLKGKPGGLSVEVDARGRVQRELSSTEALPGNNLLTSLDAGLEREMSRALAAEVAASDSPGGAIVALNPQNGQVLGMTSFPTYDNNIFYAINVDEEYAKLMLDAAHPMFNRAIAGTYPSGSTIKPVIAAAGLQEGMITENTTINAPGEIKVGNWTYPDWKVHGLTDVRKAIAESVNIFFYAVAGGWDKIKGLGVVKLDDYLRKFGFAEKTDIDLPSEAAGLVPDPAWKEKNKKEIWYLGDTYHLGIGQGDFLVTPLQMAVAAAAIANGGELLKPQVVTKITDKDGKTVREFKKVVRRDHFIDGANLQIVREGMRQAVTSASGSARGLDYLPVAAAAKTGTAQFGAEGKTHAWMIAFAPYDNPKIAIAALIEEGGEGYSSAGPMVDEILNWYFTNNIDR